MQSLSIAEIEEDLEKSVFSCGIDSIDNMIKSSYYPHILRQSKTYKIMIGLTVVGYYRLSIININLEKYDIPLADEYDKAPVYTALNIDYLAIDCRVQGYGIGPTVLDCIVKEAVKLGEQYPIRLLVFDSIQDRVEWYIKRGFKIMDSRNINGYTVKMYLDLLSENGKKKIVEYLQTQCE